MHFCGIFFTLCLFIYSCNSNGLDEFDHEEIDMLSEMDKFDENEEMTKQGQKNSNTCVSEINTQRRNNGKSAVKGHAQITSAAEYHTNYMVDKNCFSHNCPGEPKMGQRVTNTGYKHKNVGEIIIVNKNNCADAVKGWMNSKPHKDIMLGSFVNVGCHWDTCDNCDYKNYWTCVFASPK